MNSAVGRGSALLRLAGSWFPSQAPVSEVVSRRASPAGRDSREALSQSTQTAGKKS